MMSARFLVVDFDAGFAFPPKWAVCLMKVSVIVGDSAFLFCES